MLLQKEVRSNYSSIGKEVNFCMYSLFLYALKLTIPYTNINFSVYKQIVISLQNILLSFFSCEVVN